MSDLIELPAIITYCHRYPAFPPEGATVIRFSTGGKEINGSGPIEAIPLCRYDEAAQAIAALTAAIKPVEHWYQSDEEHPRPLVDILTDIVDDLQEDRQDVLAMKGVMAELDAANQGVATLTAENERLREALEEIGKDRFGAAYHDAPRLSLERRDIARAALKGKS